MLKLLLFLISEMALLAAFVESVRQNNKQTISEVSATNNAAWLLLSLSIFGVVFWLFSRGKSLAYLLGFLILAALVTIRSGSLVVHSIFVLLSMFILFIMLGLNRSFVLLGVVLSVFVVFMISTRIKGYRICLSLEYVLLAALICSAFQVV